MQILWWHWLVLGLFLLVLEMAAAGGFYFIFFGVAALIVGALAAAESGGSVPMQLLMFSVLSVVSLVIFRNRLLRRFQDDPQQPPVDQLVGEVGTVVESLAPGEIGRVELRGASWSARNRGEATLARGVRCRVIRIEGLMLEVDAEGARR
jgi:membrane protein implicated in regulation of membrane protease activity